MNLLYSCILIFLEVTFVYAALLILHGLRKVIGVAGFYIALGLLFVLMQLVGAAGFHVVTGLPGLNIELMSTGLLLPFLAAILIIYITDGTLETQRLIIGMMTALGLYLYLAKLTGNTALTLTGENTLFFGKLINTGLRSMAATVLSFAVDIFLIPIVYQGLRNWKCRLFYAVLGSLALVQLYDCAVYGLILNLGKPDWWKPLADGYLTKMIAIIWLSIMSSFYLSRISVERPGSGRNALDILIAFFGNYGKTKALEENLKQSEARFKLLFENAGDMVIVIDEDGNITDANRAAFRLTGLPDKNVSFPEISGIHREIWLMATEITVTMPVTGKILELTFTPFQPAGEDGPTEYIIFGRDVTERAKLEQEVEEWRVRTEHNQRLESIGRLAGGIAHDFNNYLHAVQGHLDLIRYMYPVENEDAERHLEKIDVITEKASLLTKQMLGFARKGSYEKNVFDPADMIRATLEMFPDTSAVQVRMEGISASGASPFRINGDMIQIQQMLLNLFINARDAMNNVPEQERTMTISLFDAAEQQDFTADPPGEAEYDPAAKYCVIRVADSGTGIPEEIRHRILEPFFTTKPVGKGTGMGLSMAYGSMLSHKGWLQCRNGAERGAIFELVFPIC